MKNDNEKFKNEFKARVYNWVLRLLKFVGKLPRTTVNEVISNSILIFTFYITYVSRLFVTNYKNVADCRL